MEDEDLVIKPRVVAGEPPIVLAELTGKLNAASAPLFEKFAAECTKRGVTRIVLDCAGLKYMGSTGFDKAVEFAGKCADAGGGVVLVNPSPKVQVVLSTLALGDLFRQSPSIPGAVGILRPATGPAVPRHPTPRPAAAPAAKPAAPRFPTPKAAPAPVVHHTPTPRPMAAPAKPHFPTPRPMPTPPPAAQEPPTFDEIAQRIGSSVAWVYREDLSGQGRKVSVRLPLPEENEKHARAAYEEAMANGEGIEVRVPFTLDGVPCAWIERGADLEVIVTRAPGRVTARAVRGGFGWWLRRLLDGKKTPEGAPARPG